jgi:hypothetical protein
MLKKLLIKKGTGFDSALTSEELDAAGRLAVAVQIGEELHLHLKQKETTSTTWEQGCQMVYFQTKNPNLGKFLVSCDERCW